MIEISSEQIDFEELRDKIKGFRLEKEWKKAQKMLKRFEL
jgi:hypothetical protein